MNTARKAVGITVLVLFLTISSTGLIRYASAFVNIVSPSKGEAVPVDSSLTVSGTSDDNAQFNCKIMIIVNDKRPYQETMPVGPGDYSKWTFVVNPQYAEIEQGINTITSKASCDAPYESFLKLDPITKEYVKHYSVNVTGVPAGAGVSSQEPFVVPAPGEDSGDGGDGSSGDGNGNGDDSTSDDSLFGEIPE
jgi:hypothetical protein